MLNEAWKDEPLTAEQKEMMENTSYMLGWVAPGWRHLWYKLLVHNKGAYIAKISREVPIAATDGFNVIVNPDTYFKLDVFERVFVAAHEIAHNMFNDVQLFHRCRTTGIVPMVDGTTLPFDNDTMQRAADYRINAMLVEARIGKMPEQGCYDLSISGPNDSVFDVYKKIYKTKRCKIGGGFDKVLEPGASTGQDAHTVDASRSAQQWAVEIAVAKTLESANRQGRLPGGIERLFNEILNPKVPWLEHIRVTINRVTGSGTYNWRRPDRRHIGNDLYMPARSGFGAGWLVVYGDTSGSIGTGELNRYIAEVRGILEDVRPKRITFLWCDAEISYTDEITDMADLENVSCRGVGGGGGSDVRPCFDWISKQMEVPDMFIGFTDGYICFPNGEPQYPVIWASTTNTNYPWGEVVRV